MESPIIRSLTWQIDPPALFGSFHVLASSLTAAAAILLAVIASRRINRKSSAGSSLPPDDTSLIRLLAVCGWILVLLECSKQIFLISFVMRGSYDWWYFPFQLCSVPMYLCILLPLTRGQLRGAVLTFLSSFTIMSAAAALIYPEDMLRSYVFLTAHGFIWHGMLLFIGSTAMLTYGRRSDISSFGRASLLFLAMCVLAVFINFRCPGACMFYLDPRRYSLQPVVGTVQKMIGIPGGLVMYVLVMTLTSLSIFLAGSTHRAADDI